MDHKQGIDRDQVFFTSLSKLIPDDSLARVIDVLFDSMPLSDLGFKHVELNKEDNDPFHPGDLFKLLLYGQRYGLRSANKLCRYCQINVEVKWLISGLNRQRHFHHLLLRRRINIETEVSIAAITWNLIHLEQLKGFKWVGKAMKKVLLRQKAPATYNEGCRQTIIYKMNNQVLPTHSASRAA